MGVICKYSCNYVMAFLRRFVLWLCSRVGIAVLPEGCRPIPSGHFNFDPQIAQQLGGRDGVARAIIFERIHGWLLYNKAHGRNQRNGQTWTFNDYAHWTQELLFWHESTVARHIRAIEAAGLLTSARPSLVKPKHYSLPAKESDEPIQMHFWGEQKNLTGAPKASVTTHNLTIHNPTRANVQSPTTTARGRKPNPLSAGVVASFPAPDVNHDLPEKRPVTPGSDGAHDVDDQGDGTHAIEGAVKTAVVTVTPTPCSAPPPSIGEEIRAIFHSAELDELVRYGEARLRHELKYVERFNETADEKRRIQNPAGFALVQCRRFPERPTPLKKTREELAQEEWEAYKLTDEYRLNNPSGEEETEPDGDGVGMSDTDVTPMVDDTDVREEMVA